MKLRYFIFFLAVLFISCSSTDAVEEEEMALVEMEEEIEEMMEMEMEMEEEEEMEEEMMEEEEEEESPMVLMGDFMDAAHPTSGTATINEERTELVLTNFKSDSGPLLELYITTDTNASQYVTLGELIGLEGDFTYELPEDIDFTTHNIIMVWCVDFDVNFGHAILE